MSIERFQRVKEIFHAALERKLEERSSFLDEMCKDDPSIRAEVEAMLAADQESDEFMEAMRPEEAAVDPLNSRLIGVRIGQYELKQIISAGGMGTVYEATQEQPKRTVAVKVMREGLLSSSSLRRFEYEAQILANLQHPHIAQIFESGTYDPGGDKAKGAFSDVPYFVMEYIVQARTLTDYAKEKSLSMKERLQLFLQVLEAVHHGHQKGVIHRDLKPANILVDGNGHVKIIDFGVARATDSDLMLTTQLTDMGQLIGTVQYMSPEQCRADPHDLDIRSDVYALGVVLYELLCEKLPYDVRNTTIFEATRLIVEERPEKPSTASRILRGDVETILLTAMEKERERRYASAEAMRRDIDHFLKGEPIAARPPSTLYQLKFFARRNKVLVSGVAAAFIMLVIGFIVSLTLYIRSEEARREAESNEEKAKSVNAFFNSMLISGIPYSNYNISGYGLSEGMILQTLGSKETDVRISEMMERAVPVIGEAFRGKPELEATVRNTFGTAYFGLGNFLNAEKHLRKAWEIRKAGLGADHPDTLRSQMQLGAVLRLMGRYQEAESLISSSLEGLKRELGEDAQETLSCMRLKAVMLFSLGYVAESDALFERTMKLQQDAFGKGSRDRLYTLFEWALAHFYQRRFLESGTKAQELYDLSQQFLDPVDSITLIAESMYAIHLENRNECSEAMAVAKKSLEKSRKAFKEDHFYTVNSLHTIACCMSWDDLEGQEPLLRQAQAGYQKTCGYGSTAAEIATIELYLQLWNRGKLKDAEQVARTWLDDCRSNLVDGHAYTVDAHDWIADVLLEQDRFEECEALLRDKANLLASVHGEGSKAVLDAQRSDATKLCRKGREDSARAMVIQALQAGRKRLEKDEVTYMDMEGYAHLLLACEPTELRDPAAALPLAQEAYDQCQGKKIPCVETLALALSMQGKHDEAVALQEKAVDLLPLGETYTRQKTQRRLAMLLVRSGDLEGALSRLRAGQDRMHNELGDNFRYIERLVEDGLMLFEEGCYEPAEPLLKKVDLIYNFAFIGPLVRIESVEALIRIYETWGSEEEAKKWSARLAGK